MGLANSLQRRWGLLGLGIFFFINLFYFLFLFVLKEWRADDVKKIARRWEFLAC